MSGVKRKHVFSSIEEEPPGECFVHDEVEEPPSCEVDEPPSTSAARKVESFLRQIPEESWNDWKWHFRNRITTVEELSKYISLSPLDQQQISLVARKYPLSITPYYLSLIDNTNPIDPIRAQSVPCFSEITCNATGVEDPLEEGKHSVVPGLVHRYPDRVLMVLTDLCSMLCRHCTRKREWKNGGWVHTDAEIERMLDYIRNHSEVRDVIISGGDPLVLSTQRLEYVISGIRQISHVEIIRIGTRFPVVLPQRIDDELCNMLSKYGPIWLNTHFNHPNEITPEAARACDKLVRAGVPVNNQSVLLKGVNDTLQIQTKLCHDLLKIKVRPYYLFQCDEVEGTEHFWTSVDAGIKIIEGMRGHTSGLAVPTYVIDLPNGGGKIPIQPDYVLMKTQDEMLVRNYQNRIFTYRNAKNGRKPAVRKTNKLLPQPLFPMEEFTTQPVRVRRENRAYLRS